MTTEEKIIDEIVDILDYFGYATANVIDNRPKWSGNAVPIGSDGKIISSGLLRSKINILKNNNNSVRKKFQIHYDNISKITTDISTIKLLSSIKEAILPKINNTKVTKQISDTVNHPNPINKPIIPASLSELNTISTQSVTPFTPPEIKNNIIPL